MGLDITAYKGLRVVQTNVKLDEDGEPLNLDWDTMWYPGGGMKWSESIWPGRGKPINPDVIYKYDDTFEFRAGSYSSYNTWRDALEKFKGDVAFQELIDFADNEGVIGTIVSKKLFDDFVKYHDEAKEYANKQCSETCNWFFDSYCDWEQAFKFASENGAVCFC